MMEVSVNFEIAVYLSWGIAIGLLVLLIRLLPALWPSSEPMRFEHPRKEALWALAAAVILFGISVTTDSLLRDWKRNPSFGEVAFLGQLLLVYTPIFALLIWRKQNLRTCFLSFDKILSKIVLGSILALSASFVFLLARHRAGMYVEFLKTLGHGGPVAMFQTFMEGFAIGFLLYRFGAWIGIRWSVLIVAVLFMAAHIPNYTSGTFNLSAPVAMLMAAAHAGIAVLILIGVWKSQDIVVFGILHWFINRASDFTTI